MATYIVEMTDGTRTECESKPFDFVRFEREFDVPFQVVTYQASQGEMRVEHLYWLAFVAWRRATNSAEITFDDWGDMVADVSVVEEDEKAPLGPTPSPGQ